MNDELVEQQSPLLFQLLGLAPTPVATNVLSNKRGRGRPKKNGVIEVQIEGIHRHALSDETDDALLNISAAAKQTAYALFLVERELGLSIEESLAAVMVRIGVTRQQAYDLLEKLF